MSMLQALSEFHFLRPAWLLIILPALLTSWWLHRSQIRRGNWHRVIAPELLPLLLDESTHQKRRSLVVVSLLGWTIATLAIAGPTWDRTPLPIHKQESALIILFDLSPSMLSQDQKPNRLTRARLKLIELLQQRKEGTTGLIAYADDAFVVSPLTDDANTLVALVPALDPNIMPGPGSHVESAVQKAMELALNAGATRADILLMTDGVAERARDELSNIFRGMGDFRLSVFGIGTAEGAPIPIGGGGFAKDSSGSIIVPRLDEQRLTQLANRHGGRYSAITADNTDINYLLEGFEIGPNASTRQLERNFDSWHDTGYWLVLLLLPILVLASRRGIVLACLILTPLFGLPVPAQALSWDDLWLTPDQQALRALQEGDTATAQEKFNHTQWKAAAAYRNGQYDRATELYQGDSAINHYNRGNALAKDGKLEEAIASYNQALALAPEMEDAQFNRELVEQLKQQQQNQRQDQPKEDPPEKPEDQQNQQQPGEQDPEDANDGSDNPSGSNNQNSAEPPDSEAEDGQQEGEQSQPENQSEPSEQSTDPQSSPGDGKQSEQPSQGSLPEMSEEEKQAMEQWLRKIPDDPGGLLREKFRYESRKREFEERRGINPPGDQEQRW
ncbi:vWA domain-containing protein [Porticoccus hydrocarbonoclasticus]|uniref:vWA domain-containing protein n=1 Tax=Porticoccus hydrocarbonoclasticus TaxID=1073414 RepID=UPI00068AF030|nr:VWA domain-containing protein [Porticoccus hydrocarbonoclasticus]|tara:strand:+ start:1943 stop:3790 length:1848 start_codon:yes stop_codon:yes gene_type:complete